MDFFDSTEEQENVAPQESVAAEEAFDAQQADVQEKIKEDKYPALREFEKVRQTRIDKKDVDSKEKHVVLVQQAKTYKQTFVTERAERIETAKKTNKEQEQITIQGLENNEEAVWHSVAKYVDLSNNPAPKKSALPKRKSRVAAFDDEDSPAAKAAQKQASELKEDQQQQPRAELKDVSRMRKILIQLKNEKQ